MKTFFIRDNLSRETKIYKKEDSDVPAEIFSVENHAPDLTDINSPLPARKKEYFCYAVTSNALWAGANNGIMRYEKNAVHTVDRVMYFSCPRDYEGREIKALLADKNQEGIWVLTEEAVSHIVLKYISAEKKALMLSEETEKFVSRRGMVAERGLSCRRDRTSVLPYGSCDNSGDFTAGYAIGELFKYAVYKKKYGKNSKEASKARKNAIRATEACQLLMYISGRGDGFVARDYQVPGEPVPEDSLMFRKEGDWTTVLDTPFAREKGYSGKVFYSPEKVPERLSALYKNEGYSDDGIVYRGDTSPDEITMHYLLIYFAHEIIGEEDRELDRLMIDSAKNTMKHIIEHGYKLCEFNGEPATWSRWDKGYFNSLFGWADACLNAAEILMYLKVVMHVSGEKGIWEKEYRHLIYDEGYAELTAKHEERFYIAASLNHKEETEELMYGDHMLATAAYWVLCTLETDEKLNALYKKGYKGWNGTFRREHNPGYDIPYMLSVPEDDIIDMEKLEEWFRRMPSTRLVSASNAHLRYDIPVRIRHSGRKEFGILLCPDENKIVKYDSNPYAYHTDGGFPDNMYLESAYVYTFAYWAGRYFGIIEEE